MIAACQEKRTKIRPRFHPCKNCSDATLSAMANVCRQYRKRKRTKRLPSLEGLEVSKEARRERKNYQSVNGLKSRKLPPQPDGAGKRFNATGHQQTWVKVNALVDHGISRLIELLSRIPHLQTIQSCQGEGEKHAYVYFYLGGWKRTCKFLFEVVDPAIRDIGNTVVRVEVFNGSEPMGEICFGAGSIEAVTSALKRALTNPHRSQCSYGRECKEPHR
jgi:hypothetical protein